MKPAILITALILFFGIYVSFAQNVSDEARRHFNRGVTAVETARSAADYENAVAEFEAAAKLAPDWADVFFNLGIVQEKLGKYEQAVVNLKRYLAIAPNAADNAAVKDLIVKTEYKLELNQKAIAQFRQITGVWSASYGQWFDEYEFFTVGGEMKMNWFKKPVSDFSFDGEFLKAKWRSAGVEPSELELSVKLGSGGAMNGILKQTPDSGSPRIYQIVMSRNLLMSTYLWYQIKTNDNDAYLGTNYTMEAKRRGFNWHIPKAGLGLDNSNGNIDFSLEARMNFINGDTNNFYGILWGDLHRNDIPENYYFFGITASGNYAFRKLVNNNWVEIISYSPSPAIRQGSASNTLTVKKKGNKLDFYINGTFLNTAPAEKFSGFIGFHLNHYMKVTADYIRIDYQ